jgi:hypothetical protein
MSNFESPSQIIERLFGKAYSELKEANEEIGSKVIAEKAKTMNDYMKALQARNEGLLEEMKTLLSLLESNKTEDCVAEAQGKAIAQEEVSQAAQNGDWKVVAELFGAARFALREAFGKDERENNNNLSVMDEAFACVCNSHRRLLAEKNEDEEDDSEEEKAGAEDGRINWNPLDNCIDELIEVGYEADPEEYLHVLNKHKEAIVKVVSKDFGDGVLDATNGHGKSSKDKDYRDGYAFGLLWGENNEMEYAVKILIASYVGRDCESCCDEFMGN